MALKVEGVVDGGMHAEKTLNGASRLEPLHFVLSSSHRLMRIFGAIILSQPLLIPSASLPSYPVTLTKPGRALAVRTGIRHGRRHHGSGDGQSQRLKLRVDALEKRLAQRESRERAETQWDP